MTRVNSDLDPFTLKDQHLMAEYREIPMIIASLRRSLRTQSKREVLKNIPKSFTLNTGHVRFFYDKLLFIERRYQDLIVELQKRNYKLDSNRKLNFDDIPAEFFNNWQSSVVDDNIVLERINEKIKMKPNWYKFYGK